MKARPEGPAEKPASLALEVSTKYFAGDALPARLWLDHCALKDERGAVYELSPDETLRRVAQELARIESKYADPLDIKDIYNLLKDFRHLILPKNLLKRIGNPFWEGLLSDCFVLGQEGFTYCNSLVIKSEEELISLLRNRAHVGIDLSFVPQESKSLGKGIQLSQGLLQVIRRLTDLHDDYNSSMCAGKPGFSIAFSHGDFEKVPPAFLENRIIPRAEITVRMMDDDIHPSDAFNEVGKWTWKDAAPSLVFEETVRRESLADIYAAEGFATSSYVPDRAIPLSANECVHRLFINLTSFVKQPFTDKAAFDWLQFIGHVHLAVRLADDLIDLELEQIDKALYLLEEDWKNREVHVREISLMKNIRKKLREGRRAAIGVTGYADMLAALGLRYGSDQAAEFSEPLFQTLAVEAFRGSARLSLERGPFPLCVPDREKQHPFIRRLREAAPDLADEMELNGRRNIALLSISEPGELSILSRTSDSLMPVFLPFYTRRRKIDEVTEDTGVTYRDEEGDIWETYYLLHPGFAQYLATRDLARKSNGTYTQDELLDLLIDSPYYQSTAFTVKPADRIRLLAIAQRWTDQGIHCIINLEKETTPLNIQELCLNAWRNGLKSVSMYRDGSRGA